MSVPSSSICGLSAPIWIFGITVRPSHENVNVPKIPRKSETSPFIISLRSQVHLRSFSFNRIQEGRDGRSAPESKEHQSKMKRKNEMRSGKQKCRQGAPA